MELLWWIKLEVTNYLLGYENLKIIQNTTMFNFSLDSVLLPNFITIGNSITKILDIGTGNAPIPLILSTKTKAKIIGVEIQKDVARLAEKSVKINKLEKQIEIINADIKEIKDNFLANSFDIITCNPPFFEVQADSKLNFSTYKTVARHEICLNLDEICHISRKLLKNNGIIGIVHRPNRLTDLLAKMREYNLEPKKIQFVHPRPDKEANIVLIEGRLNGKKGLKIMPPLISHEKDGSYTKAVQKFFK